MTKKKTDVLDDALDGFSKLYVKGGIVNLGETPRYPIKMLTGRPSIDYLTDGGIPKGRLILLAGEKSAGKSSLTIQLAGLIGKKILYVDTESTLTTDYIESLGCDPFKFNHCMPESTEQVCNIIRKEIPNYDIIVLDSINNSASEEQIEKNAEDKTMANRASVLSNQLPIIVGLLNQHGCTMFVLSQVRDNMNKKTKFDPDKHIPGGNSLHHNSSMTIELFQSTMIEDKSGEDDMAEFKTYDGRLVRMKCTKNKVGKPNRQVKISFFDKGGYLIEADLASTAIRLGIIEKAGSWLKYNGETLVQGQEKLTQFLIDNPEMLEEIKSKIN